MSEPTVPPRTGPAATFVAVAPGPWPAGTQAFRPDARFDAAAFAGSLAGASSGPGEAHAADPLSPDPLAADPLAADPLADAYTAGFAAGSAAMREEADRIAAADGAARGALELAFVRLDAALAEQLSDRLRETVALLCEQALAPLALDQAALTRRIARAVAMLQQVEGEIVIRLNPHDVGLLATSFRADWQVRPDPALPRGALRIESGAGGVEDGPEQWRAAIAEAIGSC